MKPTNHIKHTVNNKKVTESHLILSVASVLSAFAPAMPHALLKQQQGCWCYRHAFIDFPERGASKMTAYE